MPFNPLKSFLEGQKGRQQFDQFQAQQNLAQASSQPGFNSAFSPEVQQIAARSKDPAGEFAKLDKRRQQSFFNDAQEGLSLAKSGKWDAVAKIAERRADQILRVGGDLSDSDAVLSAIENQDFEGATQLLKMGVDAGISQGFLKDPKKSKTAGDREFNNLIAGFSEEDQVKARRVKAGLDARKGSSSIERIAGDPKLTKDVAGSQAIISGSREDAKFKSKLKFAPEIAKMVSLAQSEAAAKGETFTELGRAQAALPGIKDVVDKLKILSGKATFTLAGRGFNRVAKEFGFSTKGGTSRTQMISMVDNQVLPMLKPIFGSAFTVVEGDRLRDSILDPDSTPDSRVASLTSFYEQMERNIQSKQRELDPKNQPEGLKLSVEEALELQQLEAEFAN